MVRWKLTKTTERRVAACLPKKAMTASLSYRQSKHSRWIDLSFGQCCSGEKWHYNAKINIKGCKIARISRYDLRLEVSSHIVGPYLGPWISGIAD